jgi:amidase
MRSGAFAGHHPPGRSRCAPTVNLNAWLVDDGLTPTDAYCLVSTCPDFRINVYQMCKLAKLSFVAGAELPKKYILA